MKLTVKDKEFLEKLKKLMDEKHLEFELKDDVYPYFVLKGCYGDKIETTFGLSRQGVRWRFHRLFNEIYVEAYQTILWVEKNFGTQLRVKAIEIAKRRFLNRKKVMKANYLSGYEYARKHEN